MCDDGGKRCPSCGERALIELSSAQLPVYAKLGYRQCGACGAVSPWHLDDGQDPLVANNRAGRRRQNVGGKSDV